MPRTAGLVALVPVAGVQTHSVSERVGPLHEGAPTLLAVVPHLHAIFSGLELLPEVVSFEFSSHPSLVRVK